MPIFSLPNTTLRAIISTLVLNDAASVVKELVDNALDAKATAIAIEISANTLDVIQVKDNGTGIGVEDRQLVCKRGCTSKITTIEDLERLGGSSLGFRGEALASIADLSDSVTLTTRVDGEIAGSMLKYGPAGVLLSCSSASHPVGSTFRVKDFLKSIPVRKQNVVQNAAKTLSNIKKLLQSYAFARGTVRFSLKVLKGNNDKANWQYSPVNDANDLRDVAVRIIGKDVAGLCNVISKTVPGSSSNDARSTQYSIIALLAIVSEDRVKLNNAGHYFSIDGRPVTATRGTVKDIVKLYRQCLRNCAVNAGDLPASSDPLLVMHLICPPASYDVNVEPSKDEVIFMDPQAVLSATEALFNDFYGENLHRNIVTNPEEKAESNSTVSSSFDLLLAKKPVATIKHLEQPQSVDITEITSQHVPTTATAYHALQMEVDLSRPFGACSDEQATLPRIAATKTLSNMYGGDNDEEDQPLASPDSLDSDLEIAEHGDNLTRNPWSMAKLNAPIQRQSTTSSAEYSLLRQSASLGAMPHRLPWAQLTPESGMHRRPLGLQIQLPSPITSPYSPEVFQNPGPPNRPWPSRQRRDESSEPEILPETPTIQVSEKSSRLLDGWVKSVRPQSELPSFQRVSDMFDKGGQLEQDTNSSATEALGPQNQLVRTQMSLSPVSLERHQQNNPISRPFRHSLLRNIADVAGRESERDNDQQSIDAQSRLKFSKSQNHELDQIMDFEYRKKAAIARQRKSFRKLTERGLNIVQLAQLPKSTIASSDEDTSFLNKENTQNVVGNIEPPSPLAAFADRFNGYNEGPQHSPRGNPHRNRYLAAARKLTKPQSSDVEEGLDNDRVPLTGAIVVDDERSGSKMTEGDPRAYLMRHRLLAEGGNPGGLTKTRLKIRRTKTGRLPLESTPAEMTLHDLVVRVDFSALAVAEAGPGVDKYSRTGEDDFTKWTPNMADIILWQEHLVTLVDSMYRARMGNELISPNIQLDLTKTIETHCDNI